jgi:uncharacterized repeat protein (TIGR03803 family)
MTKLRTCGLFAFLPTQSRKERLRLTAAICVVLLFCAAAAIAAPAQILTTVHSFAGHPNDGALPNAGLAQASDGSFYGTTIWGGASGNCSYPDASGCGAVFKLTPSGTMTILYSFCSQPNCADGGLVQATDGNFYGTTAGGGASSNCPGPYVSGCGTVFKITPSGTLTTVSSFNYTDGSSPWAGLVQATDGSFYGTTQWGGAYGVGTVFKVTPGGTLTTLHAFNGYDGDSPLGGLVQATDGNFYGTTEGGGANGSGTVFRITPSGTPTTLYSFCSQTSCADGSGPYAGLVQASDGNFYGTTGTGGAFGNYGTIFKITPSGTLTTLYSFCAQNGCADGEYPGAELVQATDGNLYGTTQSGGTSQNCDSYGCGTVFKITPSGTLTTLHSFNYADGGYPYAGLVQARDGNFYGTTFKGGADGYGTIFRLTSVRPCFSCPLEWK